MKRPVCLLFMLVALAVLALTACVAYAAPPRVSTPGQSATALDSAKMITLTAAHGVATIDYHSPWAPEVAYTFIGDIVGLNQDVGTNLLKTGADTIAANQGTYEVVHLGGIYSNADNCYGTTGTKAPRGAMYAGLNGGATTHWTHDAVQKLGTGDTVANYIKRLGTDAKATSVATKDEEDGQLAKAMTTAAWRTSKA